MGSIIFAPKSLADSLSETAGYKAGLALSVKELCDNLSGTEFPDIILESEQNVIRIRAEEYDSIFYKLLYRIGYTEEEYNGDFTGAKYFHKYKDTALAEWQGVTELFIKMWPQLLEESLANGSKAVDPTAFIRVAHAKYGRLGLDMAMERILTLDKALKLSPHSTHRYTEWNSQLSLSKLFEGTKEAPEAGRFIDQRYINYLCSNQEQLGNIHWRKFEELTAEFFDREGFLVELGPGSNDDGVDVRVWKDGQLPTENPHCIIQCKRQLKKVEKVVVKGLFADVSYEGAEFGLIVTTSELSPGARTTISARGYPIKEVDKKGVSAWLPRLRSPGTGIVRV